LIAVFSDCIKRRRKAWTEVECENIWRLFFIISQHSPKNMHDGEKIR